VSNTDKLRDAGLIKPGHLPTAYEDVVDGLSGPEVDALISAAQQLQSAETKHPGGPKLKDCFLPL
jgi:hypothetical protein